MIAMFENWGTTEWFILVVDIVAVIIVVRFLRNKIRRKLNEVELRQSFQTVSYTHLTLPTILLV